MYKFAVYVSSILLKHWETKSIAMAYKQHLTRHSYLVVFSNYSGKRDFCVHLIFKEKQVEGSCAFTVLWIPRIIRVFIYNTR